MQGFCYLSLVTDAYSRKICGYCLYETLEARGSEEALLMALRSRPTATSTFQTIHHSDRGVQYCSARYVDLLNDADIAISMTQTGSPYENAVAERVNGIVKNEFNPKIIYKNFRQAQKSIDRIIKIYNEKRPHLSINYLTPEQAHSMQGEIKKAWKTYPKKYQNKKTLVEHGE
jgi:transposase InsO family protein